MFIYTFEYVAQKPTWVGLARALRARATHDALSESHVHLGIGRFADQSTLVQSEDFIAPLGMSGMCMQGRHVQQMEVGIVAKFAIAARGVHCAIDLGVCSACTCDTAVAPPSACADGESIVPDLAHARRRRHDGAESEAGREDAEGEGGHDKNVTGGKAHAAEGAARRQRGTPQRHGQGEAIYALQSFRAHACAHIVCETSLRRYRKPNVEGPLDNVVFCNLHGPPSWVTSSVWFVDFSLSARPETTSRNTSLN